MFIYQIRGMQMLTSASTHGAWTLLRFEDKLGHCWLPFRDRKFISSATSLSTQCSKSKLQSPASDLEIQRLPAQNSYAPKTSAMLPRKTEH